MLHPAKRIAAMPELMETVHDIGREVIAPHADEVGRAARFAKEAFGALKALKLLSCDMPLADGAALTVNNDHIPGQSATMQLMQR